MKIIPNEFIEFLRSAPVSSGVCCCGGRDCTDHEFVDQWDYSLDQWLKKLQEPNVDETVALMQGFLDKGVIGYHGLYSKNQHDFRDMWHGLTSLIWDLSNDHFDDPLLTLIRKKLIELGERAPQAPGVFAINTTFHGKDEVLQNHEPISEIQT